MEYWNTSLLGQGDHIKSKSFFELEKETEQHLQKEELARIICEANGRKYKHLSEEEKLPYKHQADDIIETQRKMMVRWWKISKSKKIFFKDFLHCVKTFGWRGTLELINYAIQLILYNNLNLFSMKMAKKSSYEYEIELYNNNIVTLYEPTKELMEYIKNKK